MRSELVDDTQNNVHRKGGEGRKKKKKNKEKKEKKLNNTCIKINVSNHFRVKNDMHILRKK